MDSTPASSEQPFEAIQKAILWSGSALIVGALLGFGLGVSVTRDFFLKRRRSAR